MVQDAALTRSGSLVHRERGPMVSSAAPRTWDFKVLRRHGAHGVLTVMDSGGV